jgi:hypothetical protein
VASKDESGPVPNWIKDVVWDLQHPKPINVQLGFVTTEHGGQFWISEQDEPGGAGCALDGEPWWVCPIDGHRVGRIGQLGH